MNETLRLLRPEDYVTTQWAGGSTTQLAICPDGALYTDRDFLWRISSATVNVKESNFTALPDYHRLISVLKGEMTLSHNGGEPFALQPYEVHQFEGSDDTHSWGQCTDFNLMLRRGAADGTVETLNLTGEGETFRVLPTAEEVLIYCADGDCVMNCEGEKIPVSAGESLLIQQAFDLSVALDTRDHAQLMICQMWRK